MQANLIWLAIIGVINAIIGVYYYLIVLKVVYLYRSEDEDKPLPISRPNMIALVVLCLGIAWVGTLFAPGGGKLRRYRILYSLRKSGAAHNSVCRPSFCANSHIDFTFSC